MATFCHAFISLILIFMISPARGQESSEGSDRGYLFLGPRVEIKSKQIKEDRKIMAYTRRGNIISGDASSPWYNAACFIHGSVILDTEGEILKEVSICRATDADGDLNWCVIWYPEAGKGPGKMKFIQGTGKWAGIRGSGESPGEKIERKDDHNMPLYEISWTLGDDSPFSNEIRGKEDFRYRDECLSFHGPHVFLESSELSNGIGLEFSTQSGVLMSMLGPETFSPRNGATCFDRGTTVKLHGKTQGDIMLLEDTDADGDVVWLYHIWWYNRGPGIYSFVDGTGKWEGIQGKGVTRGMYKGRTDDHFMLKSELVWNLPE